MDEPFHQGAHMWHERQVALAQLRANETAHAVRRQPESLPTSARFLCLMPDSLIPNAFATPTSTLSVSNRQAAIVIAAAIAKTAKTIAPGHGLVHIDRVLPRRVPCDEKFGALRALDL